MGPHSAKCLNVPWLANANGDAERISVSYSKGNTQPKKILLFFGQDEHEVSLDGTGGWGECQIKGADAQPRSTNGLVTLTLTADSGAGIANIDWIRLDTFPRCHTGTAQEVTNWCQDNGCCVGTNACTNWVGQATVCESACVGDESCTSLGEGMVIPPKACEGRDACYALGRNKQIVIEHFACRGEKACCNLGRAMGASIPIFIGFHSCVGYQACLYLSNEGSGPVTFSNNACVGEKACLKLGEGQSNGMNIRSYSCQGRESCSYIQASGSLSIGKGSCTEDFACKDATSTTSLSIGHGACTGEKSCLSIGHPPQVIIDDGQCTADNECFEQCL